MTFTMSNILVEATRHRHKIDNATILLGGCSDRMFSCLPLNLVGTIRFMCESTVRVLRP